MFHSRRIDGQGYAKSNERPAPGDLNARDTKVVATIFKMKITPDIVQVVRIFDVVNRDTRALHNKLYALIFVLLKPQQSSLLKIVSLTLRIKPFFQVSRQAVIKR